MDTDSVLQESIKCLIRAGLREVAEPITQSVDNSLAEKMVKLALNDNRDNTAIKPTAIPDPPFTKRLEIVINLAKDEIAKTTLGAVTTQHLLLALLVEGEGTCALALHDLAIDQPELELQIRNNLAKLKTHSENFELRDNIGLTPMAERVLRASQLEANALGHKRTGTGHLLIALMCYVCIAKALLEDAGVTLEATRKQVSKLKAKS
jgi:ATP-dependent Clp protease ATP-binding subunit ClpA